MRCKIVLTFLFVLLFLTVQTMPLMASNNPKTDPPIVNPNLHDPGDDPGGGEEHPWQDDDDDTGVTKYDGGIDVIISLFKQVFGHKTTKPVDSKKKNEKIKRRFSPTKHRKLDITK